MDVSWAAAHKAGTTLDTSLNLDAGDPLGRDLQLRGAIANAKLASYTSEDEWIVSHVLNGTASTVGRYLSGQRI